MQKIILAGGGHAHVQILQAWRTSPVPNTELTLISPHALAPYSGMVPGWLAGRYRYEEIVIDLPALCARAGVHWMSASIDRLDPDRQELHLDSQRTLRYDWLSLNTGSTLHPPQIASHACMLAMRPLSELRRGYEAVLEHWLTHPDSRPLRLAAVGGGAAGFESVLAVLHRLRHLRPDRRVTGRMIHRGDTLLPGHSPQAQRLARRALDRAGVHLQLNTDWSDALAQDSDIVLWATGAQAHAWQCSAERRGSLAVSPEGFIRIDACLRSVSHANILAAGDCAHWQHPLPKAGVFAVRMGPVLNHNLRASCTGKPLQHYQPQRHFLSLLSTSDGSAIASRGGHTLSGRWAWHWKDLLDRRFVGRFSAH